MTTTLTGALKTYFASLEPTVQVYRDRAPEVAPDATPATYLVVTEGISTVVEASGDYGDSAAEVAVADEVQLDLYQPHHVAATRAIAEDPDLPDRVLKHLARCTLSTTSPRVSGLHVLTSSRTPDLDGNVIRTTYRCRVHRTL